MTDSINNVRSVLRQSTQDLLHRSNVVATGIGYKWTSGKPTDTLCVVCSVEKKLPPSALTPSDLVPSTLDGLPTDVVETGRIRVFDSPTARFRPAPGGVSVGHRDITAGTLGCWVRKNGELYILSNNHVLANSNEGNTGDPILQPGPYDGGRDPDDRIAVLSSFVPIQFIDSPSDCSFAGNIVNAANQVAKWLGSDTRLTAVRTQLSENLVDAALAKPLNEEDADLQILNIGAINGQREATLGMAIQKSGRTTGLTNGQITQVDVTVNVQFGAGRIAMFTDQVMAGPISQGGDSGSAVLDMENNIIGLLFAGSEQTTIINRIENVFSALGVSL